MSNKVTPISGARMVHNIEVYVEVKYEYMGKMHHDQLCWEHFLDDHMPIAPEILQRMLWELLKKADVLVEAENDEI